jgi:cell shape-determining protein MreC
MKNYSLKTKQSLEHNNVQKVIYKRLIFIGVAFLILIFAKHIVATVTSFVTTPLFSLRHYLDTSSATIPVYIRDRTALLHDIQALHQEIESQRGIKETLSYIEKENEELRALIGVTDSPSVTASIIARPPYSPYDTVIVDRGSRDGIVSGAPVYYGAGKALGYVRSVYERYALVTLFSSPNVESSVYVFGPNIFTTAYGEGGGVIRLSIPQGISISEGDIVVLPSLTRGVLGTVSSVQSIPTEPEQHAYVLLESSMQSIRTVRVATESHILNSYDEAKRVVQEMEKTLFMFEIPESDTSIQSATSSVKASSTNSGL